MAEFERRDVADEVRAEGRTLTGTIMVYGDRAHSRREVFAPGSLQPADAVGLNLAHDRSRIVAWSPDGGLELREEDGALRMTATLPPLPFADHVLKEIASGIRNGLSVEFRAIEQRTENGIRVIEKALLRGIGIVASPDYGASRVEARSRARRIWL